MAREYAILGAGVLGLTAALRLAERGHTVTVFERGAEPGGLAAGFAIPGASRDAEPVWLEKFYHHLFRSDHAARRLISDVGLAEALEWRRPLTTTLRGGQPYQLDSPLSVLRFPPLSLPQRVHLAAGLAAIRLLPTPRPLEGRRAVPWVRALSGRTAYDAVWAPLFAGKFGAVADEVALPWFWARLHDRSAALGYVRGGFQRFYNRLAERVVVHGGTLRFATEVRGVEPCGAGFAVRAAPVGAPDMPGAQEALTFERVISTLPTRLTCQVVPALPAAYRARYDWGRAYGAHCLILALDRPLTGSYWMNIADPGYPFMVLVEHTNFLPPADYGGRHLVYLGNYRPMEDPLFRMSADAVLEDFAPHLTRINPDFRREWVTDRWAFAAPYAQPIVTTDYSAHIPPFTTPLPGLYVANMFQVYPHDRGQNYSVALAERLVRQLEGT